MRIAICDDEKAVRDMLRDGVHKYYPSAEIELFCSGEDLLLCERQPDILLLDIGLRGRDGMETARELRKRNKRTVLIFVTALKEHVFEAFHVRAFQYLVKPFTEEKFAAVLAEAVEQYLEVSSIKEEEKEKSRMIKVGGTYVKIRLADIISAEVYNRKIILHKTDGDLEYYGRMRALEEMAGEDFFRPHRAYLVHFKYVVKYDKSMIYLKKGTALMAQKNYREFVKRYLKYIHGTEVF